MRFFVAMALFFGVLAGAFAPQEHAANRASEADISGTWNGVLGSGSASLHLVLTISKGSAGEYTGNLNSVDQGAVLPMEAIQVQGRQVRFEVKRVGGVYVGELNEARSKIIGTWTQTGVPPQPLSFDREAKTDKSRPAAPTGPKTKPITVALDVSVPLAPTPFQGDGKTHLVYELRIINMSSWVAVLKQIEVLTDDATPRSLAVLSGANLEDSISRPGGITSEKSSISSGMEATVFVWVTLDRPEEVPGRIRHRLTVKLGDYGEDLSLITLHVAITRQAVVIDPPLRGGHWVAANGPSNTSGHRRALIPIDGRAAIAQRMAIDWVRLGDEGKTYRGDPLDNKNYYAYGSEALAVADGTVTEVKDGIPQNIPGANSRAVEITLETVAGNHVILDIGGGNYAFYAHLQPGSLRVQLGQKVHRGQVIGLVGNSGNSTEPHLHFHISNASSPLGSEGLPYLLPSFEVEGKGWTWKPSKNGDSPVKHTMELPLEDEVVRFPAAP